jgi:hypothetical protein
MTPATHRAQLVGMLAEAAEIEHCLMCTYLYAAFSLKEAEGEDLRPAELDAVRRWRREIVAIATDEMLHLSLVNNLAIAIGARPHYRRFNFPVAAGVVPADIAVELAPLDETTLDHFVYLERPADVAERDGARYAKSSYRRHAVAERLIERADDYRTVGELYQTIEASCELIGARDGEDRLFIGPRVSDVTPLTPAATARREAICEQTLALMHMLAEVGSVLSALPANPVHPGLNADPQRPAAGRGQPRDLCRHRPHRRPRDSYLPVPVRLFAEQTVLRRLARPRQLQRCRRVAGAAFSPVGRARARRTRRSPWPSRPRSRSPYHRCRRSRSAAASSARGWPRCRGRGHG